MGKPHLSVRGVARGQCCWPACSLGPFNESCLRRPDWLNHMSVRVARGQLLISTFSLGPFNDPAECFRAQELCESLAGLPGP